MSSLSLLASLSGGRCHRGKKHPHAHPCRHRAPRTDRHRHHHLRRRASWAPHAAVGFGIPGTPTEDRNLQAWLSVKAVRDMASRLFIFIPPAGATPHLPGRFVPAATGIPVGDALIVLRSNGPRRPFTASTGPPPW
ncbi:DUF4267 domain-containing protein [Nocardia brevicatena]|uniref:DUF4267 domain-containing protein n=1 Tax=Nocardia brevicatena TaxID=37327 RepID=UPI003F687D43